MVLGTFQTILKEFFYRNLCLGETHTYQPNTDQKTKFLIKTTFLIGNARKKFLLSVCDLFLKVFRTQSLIRFTDTAQSLQWWFSFSYLDWFGWFNWRNIYEHFCDRLSQFSLPSEHWLATSHVRVDLHQPHLYFSGTSKHDVQVFAISRQLYAITVEI